MSHGHRRTFYTSHLTALHFTAQQGVFCPDILNILLTCVKYFRQKQGRIGRKRTQFALLFVLKFMSCSALPLAYFFRMGRHNKRLIYEGCLEKIEAIFLTSVHFSTFKYPKHCDAKVVFFDPHVWVPSPSSHFLP